MKSVYKNGIYNVLYKVVNVIYPLFVASYIARVLLPSGVGKVTYAQNLVTYFTFLAALGLPTYGTREIAKSREKQSCQDQVFSELFFINAVSTTICAVMYYGMVFLVPQFAAERTLHCVAGLLIIMNYFNVDWFYQGREEFRYIALRSISIKLASIVAVFIFVKNQSDYIVYALIHCTIIAGNYLLNMIGLRKRVRFVLTDLHVRRHLMPLLILLGSSIAIELYTLLNTTLLGIFCSEEAVAYYSSSVKITNMIVTLVIAVVTVMLPKFSQYFNEQKEQELSDMIGGATKCLLFFTLPCSLGLSFVAQETIPLLFGKAFQEAVSTARITALLVVPISFSTFFGGQVLCAISQERKMLIAVCTGAVTNVILSTILIPKMAQNGAAVSALVSEYVVLFIDIMFVRCSIRIRIPRRDAVSIAAGIVGMIIVLLIVASLPLQGILVPLLLKCSMGALTYLGINWLLGNSLMRRINKM